MNFYVEIFPLTKGLHFAVAFKRIPTKQTIFCVKYSIMYFPKLDAGETTFITKIVLGIS